MRDGGKPVPSCDNQVGSMAAVIAGMVPFANGVLNLVS
jgi:hypothetical protein